MKNTTYYFRILFTAILFISTYLSTEAQQLAGEAKNDTSLGQTVKKLSVYTETHPIEKIYLQLNKPQYDRTDTIWFKLYTVIGSQHQLSDLSAVAFAELINSSDSVIVRLNLKLESGMAASNFILPPDLEPGTYHIRAYTNWMKNEGDINFYDQPINITGAPPVKAIQATTASTFKKAKTTNSAPAQPDAQFFPESGYLVNGLRSVVAFKATNPDGTTPVVNITVTDMDGNEVATAESVHAGMGVFALTPQEGKTYKANVHYSDNTVQTVALPAAVAEGYTFTVNNRAEDTLLVKIAANEAVLKSKAGSGFYLLAQSGGKVYYTTSSKLNEAVYSIKIAKNHFPTGILRLTLFSSSGEPMNERIVFIQQPDNLNLKIAPTTSAYTPGAKLSLQLSATTAAIQPVVGNFSMAVINETKVPVNEAAEPTIFSQLLLSSELHGAIQNPGYYFANQDEKTLADLDVLMLTQGYRKLEWKKLLDTVNKPPKYLASAGLDISGVITSMNDKPIANAKVRLLVPARQFTLDTLTDNNGRFIFTGLDLKGQTRVILKAKTANDRTNINIIVDQPEGVVKLSTDKKGTATLITGTPEQTSDPKIADGSKLLKEVKVNQRVSKPPPDLSFSANLNGGGSADQVVMGEDLAKMGCVTIAECLAGKLASVSIRGGNVYYVGRSNASRIGGAQPMTVFINGTIGQLDNVTADDIYSIEVLTSDHFKAIYGHDAASGLILITTKRGIPGNEAARAAKAPGLINYVFNGYYKATSFYAPKYNSSGDALNQAQRSAIYWKPDIVTDKEGKANLEYYNAGKGTYRVIVEGIDNDGRLGRQVFRYTVE